MNAVAPSREPVDPMVFVPVAGRGAAGVPYPEAFRALLHVDVIHDGQHLPPEFLVDRDGRAIPESAYFNRYVEERDWGANIVAERLAERLCLDGFWTVTTARCLMDFGRFPGATGIGASHLRRFAINHPFSELLSFQQMKRLLDVHYDGISDTMDGAIEGRLMKIAGRHPARSRGSRRQ